MKPPSVPNSPTPTSAPSPASAKPVDSEMDATSPSATEPSTSASASTGTSLGQPTRTVPEGSRPSEARTPLTVMLPAKLSAKLRLYASIRGLTLTTVVVEVLEREVPPKLRAALAEVGDDLG